MSSLYDTPTYLLPELRDVLSEIQTTEGPLSQYMVGLGEKTSQLTASLNSKTRYGEALLEKDLGILSSFILQLKAILSVLEGLDSEQQETLDVQQYQRWLTIIVDVTVSALRSHLITFNLTSQTYLNTLSSAAQELTLITALNETDETTTTQPE